jgi:hypothetical protein
LIRYNYNHERVPLQVAGGLQLALDAQWAADTRIVIFVADAPCHGEKYHTYGRAGDNYPDGDPSGHVPEDQVKEMAKRGYDFYFIKCTAETDKMITIFSEGYESGRASDAQIFCVLDLQVQGGGGAPCAAPSSYDSGCIAPGAPCGLPCFPDGPSVHDLSYPIERLCISSSARVEEEACIPSSSYIHAAAPRRMVEGPPAASYASFAPSAPMSAPTASSTSDAFLSAVTSSIKRSVVSRSRPAE